MKDIFLQREHRERWEHPNNNESNMSAQDDLIDNKAENKIITIMEKPVELVRPYFNCYLEPFEFNCKLQKAGVYHHGLKQTQNGSIETDDWICDPLIIEAITSSKDDDDYGRILKLRNSNGNWHTWTMPMNFLKGRGDELIGVLLDLGLEINNRKKNDILTYINSQHPDKRRQCATNIGWHDGVFLLPDRVIGEPKVVFQSDSHEVNEFKTSGTIDSWKQEIGQYCFGNVSLIVAISTALAGPLLRKVDHQGFGIHIVGDSSSGKSTAADIAASIWGAPDIKRTWRSTSNGIEGIAAARNDTCLILDEIGEIDPNDIGEIAYMLINGQGKQRSNRAGKARRIYRWHLTVISTGEKTLAGVMNEVGKNPYTGQEVRLLNIPFEHSHGIFDELHGFENGRQFADHLKTVRCKNFGCIGPAFISRLIDEKRNLRELHQQITQILACQARNSVVGRAAASFALICMAGELAAEYDLIPLERGSVTLSVKNAFNIWQSSQQNALTEDEKILKSVRTYINQYGDSRFSDIDSIQSKQISKRAGYFIDIKGERIYMFFSDEMQKAGGGYPLPRVAKALDKFGWIIEKDNGRYSKRKRIHGCPTYMYYVQPKEEGISES
ncbi:MAG: DUF927 domain-containing protein [Gammaproteobacteria bacterium]|jgi:putative DNA primase/helicase|nr:DUF927 domain-containing protein [Gammaproteobacteria bacterium]